MCQAFADNGHEVILLAPNHKKKSENNVDDIFKFYGVEKKFKIIFIPFFDFPKIWSFSYAINSCKYIKSRSFDIVYGRDLKGCYFSAGLPGRLKVYYETHKPFCKYNIIDKYILFMAVRKYKFERIVVISKALKNMYKAERGFNNFDIEVAHDGADFIKDHDSIQSIVNSGKLNVGYTGHLYPGRGIDIILKIAERMENSDFHVVGGSQKDIDYWKAKSSLPNVIYHGFVDPGVVYKYVNSFDVLIAPYQNKVTIVGKDDSSKYMSPLKIFEYMASNKPIIVSDLDVLHEILDEDEAEFVKCDDVEAWIDSIERLNSKEYRNMLAGNSFAKFNRFYTWKKRASHVIR